MSPLFGYQLGDDIPSLEEGMPLLGEFVREHERSKPLRGVTALLIQHQLGNHAPQLEALMRLGLDPRRTLMLDIPYTSSARFRRTVADRFNIPDRNFTVSSYRLLEPYAAFQFRRTQEVIAELLRNPPDKLIVLDDGAYFLEAAIGFRKQLPNVAIVEQTTRGVLKIEDSAALRRYADTVPIVDVARSAPKRKLESPWIGLAVLLSLEHKLRLLARASPNFAIRRDSPCVVLGYGTIGRQVAAHLSKIARVYVFDTKPARRRLAEQDGFELWDRRGQAFVKAKDLIRFKLVVGCSGRASFGVGDRVFLDRHAVLASASSGSVELSRGDFIDLAAASQIDDIRIVTQGLQEDRIHQDIRMELVDRHVVFLNGGFPVNFDGRLNCIPSRYMQPTASLMVQGAMQALNATGRGLLPVDASFAKGITRDFVRSLTPEERAVLRATPT